MRRDHTVNSVSAASLVKIPMKSLGVNIQRSHRIAA